MRLRKARDMRVGDRFRMDEEVRPGVFEVVEHQVVQAYRKGENSPFSTVMVIKTDRGADLRLRPDLEVELSEST